MIRPEVLELVAGILDRWHHARISDGALAQYERDLAELLPEHAAIAVETWYRDGERFAPSGADIVGRVADLALDAPGWAQVKTILEGRAASADGRRLRAEGRTCPLDECDGSGTVELFAEDSFKPTGTRYCGCRRELVAERAARDTIHPIVADFLAEVGEREISDVLTGDRTAEAQVRTKYERHLVSIRRQVVYRGLPDGGLAGMRRLALEASERLPRLLPGGGDVDRQPRRIGDIVRAIADREAP